MKGSLRLGHVVAAWWPLALSWVMMGAEQPLASSVVARLPDPAVQLAAYGSFAFPVALVVEAPVIMLLAASTELSRDQVSYRALRRVTHRLGLALTLLHLLIVATPLFDWLADGVFGLPPAVRGPARQGLWCLLPWTWAIASRRFHQGVLIRHGRSMVVGWGTGIRLGVSASVLTAGLIHGQGSGTVVATFALSAGVLAEAAYVAVKVHPVKHALPPSDIHRPVLVGWSFWRFYVPLAMTPMITLVILPTGTAAMARMPQSLSSLAVWPTLNAIVFILQALGLAYNEVVVALLEEPGAAVVLKRFAMWLAIGVTAVLSVVALTPLAEGWFGGLMGLSTPLAAMGAGALWVGIPIPATRVLQSWYQGVLVNARQTRGITEAVAIFAMVSCGILVAGWWQARWHGLLVVIVAYSVGRIIQTGWLAWRVRGV